MICIKPERAHAHTHPYMYMYRCEFACVVLSTCVFIYVHIYVFEYISVCRDVYLQTSFIFTFHLNSTMLIGEKEQNKWVVSLSVNLYMHMNVFIHHMHMHVRHFASCLAVLGEETTCMYQREGEKLLLIFWFLIENNIDKEYLRTIVSI